MALPLNRTFASQSQQSGCSQLITFFGSHARLLLMVSQFTLELQGQIQAIYILRKVYYMAPHLLFHPLMEHSHVPNTKSPHIHAVQ